MSVIGNTSTNAPAVSFKTIGDAVGGRIVDFKDYQEQEFADDPRRGVKKGDPKVYPSGDPVMATMITLETEPGNPESRKTLYAKGKRMLKAIALAVKVTGAEDIEAGGDLAVTFVGYEGPAKLYQAAYAKPEAEVAAA